MRSTRKEKRMNGVSFLKETRMIVLLNNAFSVGKLENSQGHPVFSLDIAFSLLNFLRNEMLVTTIILLSRKFNIL